jgi:hypothetical protein
VTIFLTLSALVNIGLGYWLATYLAREKARAGADVPMDVSVDATSESHVEYGQAVSSAPPAEMPLATLAAPMMPPPMAAAAPTTPAAVAVTRAPGAEESLEAPKMAAAADSAELETEVLAGIEEFRIQLAQMKATPDAAEPVAASV